MDHEKKHLFDDPRNVKWFLRALYAICAVLILIDFIVRRQTVHDWENLWGFYGIYGFVSCVSLVLIAKGMRRFLKRPEDYYEDGALKGRENDSNVDA